MNIIGHAVPRGRTESGRHATPTYFLREPELWDFYEPCSKTEARLLFADRVNRRPKQCDRGLGTRRGMYVTRARFQLRGFRQKGYRRRSADRIFVVRPRTVFASVAVESPPSIGGVIRTPNRRDNPFFESAGFHSRRSTFVKTLRGTRGSRFNF